MDRCGDTHDESLEMVIKIHKVMGEKIPALFPMDAGFNGEKVLEVLEEFHLGWICAGNI